MSGQRKVGRPSKGDRSSACTRLPPSVRADVDQLAVSGLHGEMVARLAEVGLQHIDEATFVPSPTDAVPTWTRLPRPVRNAVDELVKNTSRSISDVVAALVAVGLRHHRTTPPRGARQEVLMT